MLNGILKMTVNGRESRSSRSDDEAHDQIGSTSATPSGVATPRPDPSDKRFPGIMHGYFGQVGSKSTTSPRTSDRCPLTTPMLDGGVASFTPEHRRETMAPDNALPTAPNSPLQDPQDRKSPVLQNLASEHLGASGTSLRSSAYPTPPMSSASSFTTQKEKENNGKPGGVARSTGGSSAGRPPLGRQQSATDVIPLRTRGHTPGLKSLSGIITDSPVHAAHLSNPTSARSSTTPSTPTSEFSQTSAITSLSSYLELAKLTENVASLPRQKSTPPLTPRALSNDDSDSGRKAPAPTSNPTQSPPDDALFSSTQQEAAKNESSTDLSSSQDPLPVGPPKGKLSIKISAARGLRPSYDPYVVCVFEWNEYISKGPKLEDSDMEKNDTKGREEGLPIKRSGSDMGRSMAIPMKSRQSSTTSLSDQKNFKSGRQVTDPSWEHEATLYVE